MEAVDAEMWQDAQGQPEDSFSPFVAATELDDVAEEHQEKKEENPPGTPLQPEEVPGVESKATERQDDNKNKGTFQDTSASPDRSDINISRTNPTLQDEHPLLPLPGLLRMASAAALDLRGTSSDNDAQVLEVGVKRGILNMFLKIHK